MRGAKQRKIVELRVSERTLGTKEEAATAMHTAATAKKPSVMAAPQGQVGILNAVVPWCQCCLSFT